MLTEEQIEKVALDFVKKPGMHGYIEVGDLIDFARALLAAHSAEVQEPVAEVINYRDVDGDLRSGIRFLGEALEDGTSLYAHPQPMPQTDAARDVLVRAKRMLEGYADSYKRMGQDSTSRGGDGRITCTAIMYDIRDNMIGWIDAEIERLDRAKGE